MRQTHAAGERLFVDYAGDGVPVVVDRLTGEIRMAQIFVAVLGASSFTFAKATWTQALPDWIDAMCAPSRRSAAYPSSSCRTMRRPPSSGSASTTLRSIGPTPRWRPTTEPPSCRRGRENRAIRRWLHTAPRSDVGAVMADRRAGRAPRPPQPLRTVWPAGTSHRPRRRLSL
jgi:transposase